MFLKVLFVELKKLKKNIVFFIYNNISLDFQREQFKNIRNTLPMSRQRYTGHLWLRLQSEEPTYNTFYINIKKLNEIL